MNMRFHCLPIVRSPRPSHNDDDDASDVWIVPVLDQIRNSPIPIRNRNTRCVVVVVETRSVDVSKRSVAFWGDHCVVSCNGDVVAVVVAVVFVVGLVMVILVDNRLYDHWSPCEYFSTLSFERRKKDWMCAFGGEEDASCPW